MMRLLMIAPGELPVPGNGSVEISMLALAKQLALSHEITIVSRRYPGLPHKQKEGNLTIARVPAGRPSMYLSSVLKFIRTRRFDRIQVDNRPGFLPSIKEAFPGTPLSVFLHSMTFVSGPKDKTAYRLSMADFIVCNSRSLQQEVIARFPELENRASFVHLGVDLKRFRPPKPEERQQLRRKYKVEDAFAVVFAGRMIPRKGLSVLIRAVSLMSKKVPHATLIVAGCSDNKYALKMKKLARRLRISARFIGRQPHPSIRKVYWLGDCFVCPSQKHEAFGLVNLEAMSSGLPCIASDIGGIGEIIVHKRSGLLVKNYSKPEAFARKMVKLARSKPLSEQLAQQAQKEAKANFGWKTAAENLLRLY